MNFYPRPPGGGRPVGVETLPPDKLISIHALRVEGDPSTIREYRRSARFLSTPSGWRATLHEYGQRKAMAISIHALRMEGDDLLK